MYGYTDTFVLTYRSALSMSPDGSWTNALVSRVYLCMEFMLHLLSW